MAGLYDEDIVLWSERQADALRRRAANEIDWENVAEEIEAVGRSEINATLSQIDNILRHRLCLLGWPNSPSERKWQVELREFHRQLRRYLTPSMTGGLERPVHMETEPASPLPQACPWSLSEILSGV